MGCRVPRTAWASAALLLVSSTAIWAQDSLNSSLHLTLRQAMGMAVTHHVQVQLALEQAQEATARAEEARAALRPAVGFNSYQMRQTQNLRAMGLALPGFPTLIGPFNTFDARVQFTQQILDLVHVHEASSAQTGVEVARLEAAAREQQIAGAAGLAYLAVQQSMESVKAAQANETLSQHLLQLTRDQLKSGLATGVDEVRAAASEAQVAYQLQQALGAAKDALTRLHRALGLPLDLPIELTDTLGVIPASSPDGGDAVDRALHQRPELQALEKTLEQRVTETEAAKAASYPTIGLIGAIGPSGVLPTQYDYRTYSYGIQMSVPLYQGGALVARQDQAESRRRQAELALKDGRHQVEEDVRLAEDSLNTSRAQVKAAQLRLDLAQRLMQQAQDRFVSGVADNLEMVDAQAGLAQARSDQIGALGALGMAQVNYDLALGQIAYETPTQPESLP